ncbi:MAG: hypothetical protein FLDDKLPJ_03620 [Phycisphaerae bacterium]|nr:hypothetical protein [Phycisphaerae bacterium]
MTTNQTSKGKVPENAWASMAPKTREILLSLRKARGNSFSFKSKDAHEARIRQKALRRARARGYIKFKTTERKGATVIVTLR